VHSVPAKADSRLHGGARFTLLYPMRTIFNAVQVSNARNGSIGEPFEKCGQRTSWAMDGGSCPLFDPRDQG